MYIVLAGNKFARQPLSSSPLFFYLHFTCTHWTGFFLPYTDGYSPSSVFDFLFDLYEEPSSIRQWMVPSFQSACKVRFQETSQERRLNSATASSFRSTFCQSLQPDFCAASVKGVISKIIRNKKKINKLKTNQFGILFR